MFTTNDIVNRVDDIHNILDIDWAYLTYEEDENGSEIVRTAEEKITMYEALLDKVHDMIWDLARGISKGELPPPMWAPIEVPAFDISEIMFHPNWDHHFCNKKGGLEMLDNYILTIIPPDYNDVITADMHSELDTSKPISYLIELMDQHKGSICLMRTKSRVEVTINEGLLYDIEDFTEEAMGREIMHEPDIRTTIRDKMKQESITQEMLAKKTGTSQSLIAKFLTGTAIANDTLQSICRELKVPYQSLEREKLIRAITKLNVKYKGVLEGEKVTLCKE